MAAQLKRRRRLGRQDLETLIGVVAMVAVALALWLASAGGKSAQEGGTYVLTARFDQVDGLVVGNPVFLAGIQIGSVLRIELAPGSFKPVVTMGIRRGVDIPADSAALVMSDGVLGGKFIRIEPGAETDAMKPGERFGVVQDSVIVETLLQKIVQGAEARRRAREEENRPKPPEKKPDAPDRKPDEQKQ